MSKKLQKKQQRRLAEEAKRAQQRKEHRTANLITIGIAAAVAIAVIVLVVVQRNDEAPTANVGVSASEANCSEPETFDSEGNEHVDAGTTVDYQANPPTTGDHWPTDQLAQAGFSEVPIEPERLVHNQEHGQIVIFYRPDAPQDVIDDIEALIAQDETPINIAAPWDDIEDPYNFVLTAWSGEDNQGVQMRCELASQQVWNDFREDHQGRGPEQVQSVPIFSPDG